MKLGPKVIYNNRNLGQSIKYKNPEISEFSIPLSDFILDRLSPMKVRALRLSLSLLFRLSDR